MTDSGDSSSSSAATPASRTDISAVSLKIPPFWPSDPEVWFAQVEAAFTTRGISLQKTKFDHVIASLSPDVAVEIRDLILRPPTDNPYDVLRRELIQRTAKSDQHRLQQLLTGEQLGDRKPTQLLRRMEQLMGDHAATDSAFLRELFLQRLPSQARMVLASTDNSVSLSQLAQLADKILEVATPSSVASVDTTSSLASEVEQIRAQVSQLQETIQTLHKPSFTPKRTSSRSSSPRPTSPGPQALCWYHQKYGTAAKKCKPPCDWVKGTGHTLAATGVAGHSSSRLFFVSDKSSGTRFLVDTGADVSVIPPTQADRSHRQDFCLQAVNGTPIHTYGTKSLTLNLGLRRKFHWGFIIADVKRPIIGADFLHHFSLLVDMTNQQLLDDLTNLRVQGISCADPPSSPDPSSRYPKTTL